MRSDQAELRRECRGLGETSRIEHLAGVVEMKIHGRERHIFEGGDRLHRLSLSRPFEAEGLLGRQLESWLRGRLRIVLFKLGMQERDRRDGGDLIDILIERVKDGLLDASVSIDMCRQAVRIGMLIPDLIPKSPASE